MILEKLRNTADICRDDRKTVGHRFQDDVGASFPARGKHEYVRSSVLSQCFRMGQFPHEYEFGQTHGDSLFFQFRFERTTAHNSCFEYHLPSFELDERSDKCGVILLRGKASDGHYPNRTLVIMRNRHSRKIDSVSKYYDLSPAPWCISKHSLARLFADSDDLCRHRVEYDAEQSLPPPFLVRIVCFPQKDVHIATSQKRDPACHDIAVVERADKIPRLLLSEYPHDGKRAPEILSLIHI